MEYTQYTELQKYQLTIITNRLKVTNGINIKCAIVFGIDDQHHDQDQKEKPSSSPSASPSWFSWFFGNKLVNPFKSTHH